MSDDQFAILLFVGIATLGAMLTIAIDSAHTQRALRKRAAEYNQSLTNHIDFCEMRDKVNEL